MSLFRLCRSGATPSDPVPSDAPVFIIGHGAGGTHFKATHPLGALALRYSPLVYSLQLPMHGEAARRTMGAKFDTIEDKIALVEAGREQAYREILSVVRNRYVVFLGYSSSAVVFMKLFHRLMVAGPMHPLSLLVCLGSGLLIKNISGVRAFWQETSFTSDPPRLAAMQALHRDRAAAVTALQIEQVDDEAWRNCVKWCAFTTGNPKSPFYSNEEERRVLFSAPVLTYAQRQNQQTTTATLSSASSSRQPHYVFFIQGTADEPFPPDDVLVAPLKEVEHNLLPSEQRDLLTERLILIPNASHFRYFTSEAKKGSLETAMRRIEETIEKWAERDVVTRYQVQQKEVAGSNPRPNPVRQNLTSATDRVRSRL